MANLEHAARLADPILRRLQELDRSVVQKVTIDMASGLTIHTPDEQLSFNELVCGTPDHRAYAAAIVISSIRMGNIRVLEVLIGAASRFEATRHEAGSVVFTASGEL